MKLGKLNWILIPLCSALTYLGTLALVLTPAAVRGSHSVTPAAPTVGDERAPWNYSNPELDTLVAELKTEKDALAAREQAIKELETRLQTERAELKQVTQTVYQMRCDLDQTLVRVKEEETANLKKLAKLYATMTPEGAVAIFKELPDDIVVKVFLFMKDAESAPILQLLAKAGGGDPKRAAQLAEKLRLAIYRNPSGKTAGP